jgi:hypothetical protein
MLITLALMLAAPQGCTEVKQQCRACASSDGKQRCSNIGIACQPSLRVCRPKEDRMRGKGSKTAVPTGS